MSLAGPASFVLLGAVLSCASLLGLAGCASRSDNRHYTGCQSDTECAAGETCHVGFCVGSEDGGRARDAEPSMDASRDAQQGIDARPDDARAPMDAPPGVDAPDGGSCAGAGATCNTSMAGRCAAGTIRCTDADGGAASRCVRNLDPAPETCNAADDDCDGSIDESADVACYGGSAGCIDNLDGTFTCAGVCATGVQRCSDGMFGLCEGEALPSTEPDGCTPFGAPAVDDDCDGEIDEECTCTEGETIDCYSGPAGTAGVGRCASGRIECTGGTFGACTGEVLPRPEACDNGGMDDDCDGVTDDVPGLGEPCDTGLLGACADGVATCVGGAVGCVGPSARAEVCDGLDDDCDGTVDDGFDFDSSEEHCGGCNLGCGAGRTCCGGECVSTDSDTTHCGACDVACSGSTGACCGGACRAPTAGECTGCGTTDCAMAGLVCCAPSCIDTLNDPANCGGCGPGFACDAGERCCGGSCVGDSDAACGGCDPCGADERCCGPAGMAACVADLDPVNCQGCGVVCGAGQTCCGLGCSNLLADVRNCGACGRACTGSATCSSGLCCPMGQYNSDGLCCAAGTYNSRGICCPTGRTNCGGACVNLLTDERHCGACAGVAGNEMCSGLSPRCCGGNCNLAISCAD